MKKIDQKKVIESRFMEDCNKIFDFNGKPMSRGFYNLAVSIRDVGLWCRGMKPHRHWYISDVKKYFNLKGNKNKIYSDLIFIRDVLFDVEEDHQRNS